MSKEFWPLYLREFFPGKRTAAFEGLDDLLRFLRADPDMKDPRYQAYILATVKRECGERFEPCTEIGGHAYFNKYEPRTPLGIALGNTHDGDGFKYRGRGYVQLTGRTNYAMMSHMILCDVLTNPDATLVPETAYWIMSKGLILGSFTGHKLRDFFSPTVTDWVNARKCVNGLDHAKEIAQDAIKFKEILDACAVQEARVIS